ncbi:MAG: nicotinate phosphoribosyltransferase [Myxococcota bacterium]|nr:nicotinate phosphoribosyltransferase [Myxococcota bacterium]
MVHPHSALSTDLYQLTMACAAWRHRMHDQRTVFHLSYRRAPFGGAYTITAGLALVVEYLKGWRFDRAARDYLAEQRAADGGPRFPDGFLRWLEESRLEIDLDAIPEGRLSFPHSPLLRVEGPLAQAQLLETPLLSCLNFQTLIATKASRVVDAAGGAPVLEFGLRRAQGLSAGLEAARAAYLGGCAATSNVAAGLAYQIPIRGTHAHSWVMLFQSELEAFTRYCEADPADAVLLVDTYNTLQGVERAIEAASTLRAQGHTLRGIRLDSGDLAALSQAARSRLDEAGFPEVQIVASDDLDEHKITQLKAAGAQIDCWGVGTRLVTGGEQSALGGVYKLAGRLGESGWAWSVKRSENPIKVSYPGRLQLRRLFNRAEEPIGDILWNLEEPGTLERSMIPNAAELTWQNQPIQLEKAVRGEELLQPVLREGALVNPLPSLEESRALAQRERARLPAPLRSLQRDQRYPLALERGLAELRERLNSTDQIATSEGPRNG